MHGKLILKEMSINFSFTGRQKEYREVWAEWFINAATVLPWLSNCSPGTNKTRKSMKGGAEVPLRNCDLSQAC